MGNQFHLLRFILPERLQINLIIYFSSMVEKLYSYKLDFWKLTVALNNCPSRHPVLVFLVVWFSRGSRGLVTWWAKGVAATWTGKHATCPPVHLPWLPQTRRPQWIVSISVCTTVSPEGFFPQLQVYQLSSVERRSWLQLITDALLPQGRSEIISFQFLSTTKSLMSHLTPPLLQSRNHAWPGSQAWGCRPKLLHRWQIYAVKLFEILTWTSQSDTTQGNIDFHSWIQVNHMMKFHTTLLYSGLMLKIRSFIQLRFILDKCSG